MLSDMDAGGEEKQGQGDEGDADGGFHDLFQEA
jgi:hypothetical protein